MVNRGKTLCLKKRGLSAYCFGRRHGLHREIDQIINMDIRDKADSGSRVRRGYVVELFQRHGIFEEFKQERWPYGNTCSGRKKTDFYLKKQKEHEASLIHRVSYP